jgi:hypothetical protein
MKVEDYCPFCLRVTPHIKDLDEKICKRCGRKEKRLKAINLLISSPRR